MKYLFCFLAPFPSRFFVIIYCACVRVCVTLGALYEMTGKSNGQKAEVLDLFGQCIALYTYMVCAFVSAAFGALAHCVHNSIPFVCVFFFFVSCVNA